MSNMPICGHPPSLARGERDEPIGGHLLAQRLELVPRRRDLVPLLVEQALAVVHGPWVEVERHEVLLAVEPGRGALEPLAEVGQVRPHVGDVADDALGRERPHPVAGEPAHHIVGLLDVRVEVLLVRVVVDGVDRDVDAGRGDRRSDRGFGLLVGVVRPERDGADVGGGRGGALGGGRRGGRGAVGCGGVTGRWRSSPPRRRRHRTPRAAQRPQLRSRTRGVRVRNRPGTGSANVRSSCSPPLESGGTDLLEPVEVTGNVARIRPRVKRSPQNSTTSHTDTGDIVRTWTLSGCSILLTSPT